MSDPFDTIVEQQKSKQAVSGGDAFDTTRKMLAWKPPTPESEDIAHPSFTDMLTDPFEMVLMAVTGGGQALPRIGQIGLKGVAKEAVDWGFFGMPSLVKGLKGGVQNLIRGLSAKNLEELIPPERALPIHIPTPLPTKVTPLPSGVTMALRPHFAVDEVKKIRQFMADNPKDLLTQRLKSKNFGEKTIKNVKERLLSGGGPPRPTHILPDPLASKTDLNSLKETLTKLPQTTTTVERMKVGEAIANRFHSTTTAFQAKLNRLKGIGQGLWDAYRRPPIVTDYKKAFGNFLVTKMWHNMETDRFVNEIVKDLSPETQEAMVNFLEADGHRETLIDRAAHAQPGLKKGYENALQLSPEHIAFVNDTRLYFNSKLDELVQAGLLDHGVENYAYHIFEKDPSLIKKTVGELNALNTNPALLKQRFFSTYFDAEAEGFIPKNKSIGFLISSYEKSHGDALNSRTFINTLKTLKAEDGRPLLIPRGVTSAAKEELRQTGVKPTPNAAYIRAHKKAIVGYSQIPHPALNGLEVHPILVQPFRPGLAKTGYPNLENILMGSRTQRSPFMKKMLTTSATAKGTILSLFPIPFHEVQTGVHGLFHGISPFPFLGTKSNFFPKLLPFPELVNNPQIKELVSRGLMVYNSHALQEFGEGLASSGALQKFPVLGPLGKKYGEYLFGGVNKTGELQGYIPRLKMSMGLKALEKNIKRYSGKLNYDQILELTASESNAAFGEQNYEWMGRNKTTQDVLKLLLFAPDFLEARLRFVGQAISPYGKEQWAALLKGAAGMWGAARVLNMITNDGNPKFGPNDLFAWTVGGHKITMRSVPGDMQHAWDKPGAFMYYRLHPLTVRAPMEFFTERDQVGRKRTVLRQGEDLAASLTPIVMSNMARDFVNKGVDAEFANDFFSSILQSVGVTRYKVPNKER